MKVRSAMTSQVPAIEPTFHLAFHPSPPLIVKEQLNVAQARLAHRASGVEQLQQSVVRLTTAMCAADARVVAAEASSMAAATVAADASSDAHASAALQEQEQQLNAALVEETELLHQHVTRADAATMAAMADAEDKGVRLRACTAGEQLGEAVGKACLQLLAHVIHGVGVVLIARYSVEAGVETSTAAPGRDRLPGGGRPRPSWRNRFGMTASPQVRDDRVLSWDVLEGLLPGRKYSDACEAAAHHEAQQQAGEQRPLPAGLHPKHKLLVEPRLNQFGRHDRALR
ncbi:hypothetical protein QJQ45_010435 [Haematococcus lacustris]|nr:hypothetical protein QJQ45_010435 [Haematococcus lacustris]